MLIFNFTKKKIPLENPIRVDGKITLKWILRKWDGTVCTGFIWLRIETNGGIL
jgi:hypothetical protein